jgi:hypothetical protein
VLRLGGGGLLALLLALLLLVALAAWSGYRLGRRAGGAVSHVSAPEREGDVEMSEGELGGDGGFSEAVTLTSGHALLVLRTGSLAEAEAARDELKAGGLPVRLDQDPRRPKGDRFRVLVGPFSKRDRAEAARGRLGPWKPPIEPEVVWIE